MHLSPSWLRPGASWGCLGVVLELSCGVLGLLGAVLGAFWKGPGGVLRLSWSVLERLGGALGQSFVAKKR